MRLTARVAARKNQRSRKLYRLSNGIPASIRRPSAGRKVLESISRHRKATAYTIRKDMPSGFSDATLRFYLGKFQRDGVVLA